MTLHEKIAQARLLGERASAAPWHWKCAYEHHKHEDKGLDTDCENIEAGRITLEPGILREWTDYTDDAGISVSRQDAEFIAESRMLLPALSEALAIAVSALEHECCCVGDEGPADVCSACLAVREIGKKMGVEG